MTPPKLHLSADASLRALHKALLARGYDVTRTPADWIELDASDKEQLLAATAQGRCLFTFSVRGLTVLARRYPQHGGIVAAVQASWSLTELFEALDRLMLETQAGELTGQVRWLNDWRVPKR